MGSIEVADIIKKARADQVAHEGAMAERQDALV